MRSRKVGLVVVNFGDPHLLRTNLTPELTERADLLVFVVENFSTLENRHAVKTLCAEMGWRVLAQNENLGFGVGVNIGFRAAVAEGCEVLVTLNPDARMTSEVLDALVAQAFETPTALITPRMVDSAGNVFFSGSTLDLRSGRLRGGFAKGNPDCVDWVTAACLAVHAWGWAASGKFDPDYFLYWEDVDFSYRSRQAGLDLVVRQDLVAVHDEGGTQGGAGRRKSNLYYRYCCRNRLLFAAKRLSLGERVRWLLTTPRESAAVYLRGGRRQLFTSPSGVLAVAQGTIEGVGLLLRSFAPGSWSRPKQKAEASEIVPSAS